MIVALLIVGSLLGRPPEVRSALETLSKCQDGRAEECQFAAAWLKMGGDAAMPEVLKAASGMTQSGQILTVNAIGSVGTKAATDCLGKLAQDAKMDSIARTVAIEQLAARPEDRRVKFGPTAFALTLITDSDESVRQAAVRLLANRVTAKDAKVIRALKDAFEDGDGGVRSEAIAGFGLCGCKEAPAMLALALRDQDMRVRRATVDGLAMVKHPVVVPDLVDIMSMRDPSLNTTIARALRFQSGQGFGTDANDWKTWLAQNR